MTMEVRGCSLLLFLNAVFDDAVTVCKEVCVCPRTKHRTHSLTHMSLPVCAHTASGSAIAMRDINIDGKTIKLDKLEDRLEENPTVSVRCSCFGMCFRACPDWHLF